MILGELPVHLATSESADALRDDEAVRTVEILGAPAGKDELLDAIALALGFPDYFGRNWDALDEALRDVETDRVTALVVRDGARMWSAMPDEMSVLVEVWLSAAGERGGDLHLVVVW